MILAAACTPASGDGRATAAGQPAAPVPVLIPGPERPAALQPWGVALDNHNDGPAISCGGAPLSFGTSLVCVLPGWKGQHFWMQKHPLAVEPRPGGLRLASAPAGAGAFLLDVMALEPVNAGLLRITVDGHLAEDVPALVEYIPLVLPITVIEGAEVEDAQGMRQRVGSGSFAGTRPGARLVLRTAMGELAIAVAEGEPVALVDRRERPYKGRRCFLVQAGDPQAPRALARAGDRYRHELTVTVPTGWRSFPALAVATTAAATALPTAIAQVPGPDLALCPAPRVHQRGAATVALPAAIALASELGEASRLAALLAEGLAGSGATRPVRAEAPAWVRIRRLADPPAGRWDLHRIAIGADGVDIEAVSPAAAGYALDTLAQLARDGALPCDRIEDWADFRFRGIHLLADADALALHGALLRRVLGPLRFNHLILECQYVRWPSHPELHQPWGMPLADVHELLRRAGDRFIAVSPLLQTYGHSEYLFARGANRDLAEDEATPYAYDVSNPRTYRVVGELLADVRAAFPRAPYLHIGHDEVTIRGRYPHRPANRGVPIADLLDRDLAFYRGWAREHGVELMLWQDFLNGRSHPAERESLLAVASRLERSSVVAVWDYRPGTAFPEVDQFAALGLAVVGATGEEEPDNVVNFARYGRQRGILGMLHTTWTGYNGNGTAVQRWPRKIWPYWQAGVSFWNADAPRLAFGGSGRAGRLFDALVGDRHPEVRRRADGDRLAPLDLAPLAAASLGASDGFPAGLLRTAHGGAFVLPGVGQAAGVLVAGGASLRLPLGRPARGLSLLWANLSYEVRQRELGWLAFEDSQGARLAVQPIVLGRETGNLVQGLVNPGGNATGIFLDRTTPDQVFPVARPVFAPAGRPVLWQYDRHIDPATATVVITAVPGADLVVAGMSVVE
jgi:hypothetical protein